ncbi:MULTISPECIES: hypothetical protein [Micrococcaceae]|nr:hypothetical protein [Arthrobacter sp. MYb214]MCS3491973.1 hypothetical protein [Arthrobacter sp. JUb119]
MSQLPGNEENLVIGQLLNAAPEQAPGTWTLGPRRRRQRCRTGRR